MPDLRLQGDGALDVFVSEAKQESIATEYRDLLCYFGPFLT